MDFAIAEQNDLDFIAKWLQSEDEAYQARRAADPYSGNLGKGFWCNWKQIRGAFERRELEVVRVGGAAVAVHFGRFISPGITEVHPDFRGQGIGTAIMRYVLQQARANQVCMLHVQCISDVSLAFWSKFGFAPAEKYEEEFYLVLRHPLPLPRHPDTTVTVNFFGESGWYGGSPYKRVEIPCLVEGAQILLSEICHDEVISSKGSGDHYVQVLLDRQVIFGNLFDSDEANAFGFGTDKYGTRIAKRFDLASTNVPISKWRTLSG